jgi:hypothetical protein
MARNVVVNPGDRFGFFTVLEEAPRQRRIDGTSLRAFVLRCDCGTVKTVRLAHIKAGVTVSCGCFNRTATMAKMREARITHGASRTPVYEVWKKMKGRCHNPEDRAYPWYGGRGIEVCQEWRDSFEAFAAYMASARPG